MEKASGALESVRCSFVFEVGSNGTWSICRYRRQGDGKVISASGDGLPKQKHVVVDLHGKWEFDKKDARKVLRVSYFDYPPQTEEASIIGYLVALQCGIGFAKAKAVYEEFGEDSWTVIDEHPYELKKVKGIDSFSIRKLIEKRTASSQLRNLLAICSDAGVSLSPTKMRKIIKEFGNESTKKVEENPYCLTKFSGISFDLADAVAESLGIAKNFGPRRKSGVFAILDRAAICGHVCLPLMDTKGHDGKLCKGLLSEMKKSLQITEDEAKETVKELFDAKKLRVTKGFVYTSKRFEEESNIAKNLKRLMRAEFSSIGHIDPFIEDYEKENFQLADSQREAVRRVFESQVNIITGGPGTGKTTVIKAVLYAHRMVFGESSEPILLAPTGKAARRMSEATDYPAQTIHSAVGFRGDDVPPDSDAKIDGNLIIIDECSMMDQEIASVLLEKIPTGAKVVFVGDPDQLPSVGCGNVLADMINSKAVPTTKLSVIFRQEGDNPIVVNSFKVNNGRTDLVFNNSFVMLETKNDEDTFNKAYKLYLKCISKYGINNVILLNPQRRNTDLSLDAFNKKIQETVHEDPQKYLGIDDTGEEDYIRANGKKFFVGDKIMQLKNTESARNGDIGFIRDIKDVSDPDDPENVLKFAVVEFNDDGVLLEYSVDQMSDVDLAYATTVHKSQGSEYRFVIEVVSMAHPAMLKRQLLYTGITRSKENVALIGQKEALVTAVKNGEPEHRWTLLSARLK